MIHEIKERVIGVEEDEENVCTMCGGTGEIEIMGDGPNFEWDVIRTERCECVDKIPF